jgi:DNA-binding MarR family transcriptional regulator
MGGALGGGMDAMFFGLKRAHQGCQRFGHAATKEFGLTPARFDLLFALKQRRDDCPLLMTQHELRGVLGVSAPTVSRMLRSLERLALVWRGPRRRNTREVALTVRGRMLIRRAAKRLLYSGVAYRVANRAIRRFRKELDFVRRGSFDEKLAAIRRYFGDVATLYYPWDPDD